jgi:hypothetical protein
MKSKLTTVLLLLIAAGAFSTAQTGNQQPTTQQILDELADEFIANSKVAADLAEKFPESRMHFQGRQQQAIDNADAARTFLFRRALPKP